MFAQQLALRTERAACDSPMWRSLEHVNDARKQSGPPLRRVMKQRGDLFVGVSAGTSKCRCQTRCGCAVCRVGARVEVAQSTISAEVHEP
jgi:hypothetical protein